MYLTPPELVSKLRNSFAIETDFRGILNKFLGSQNKIIHLRVNYVNIINKLKNFKTPTQQPTKVFELRFHINLARVWWRKLTGP